jgi:hypothetical protein
VPCHPGQPRTRLPRSPPVPARSIRSTCWDALGGFNVKTSFKN